MQALAFDEPLRKLGTLRLPLVKLYLTERCNSRCVTGDYGRHGRVDMNLESVTQLLPSLVQLQTQVVLALWRESDSRATADFLLPGKAYV